MRILLAALVLVTGTSTALACGNPLLWAMLFARVPEAKVVYEAELAARGEGLVTARVYDARPGQIYHLWSKAWILDLAEEMQPATGGMLEKGETFTILLADEVAAVRFSPDRSPEFLSAAALRSVDGYDLVTTINALNSAWRHGLSYRDMLAFNLVSTQDLKGEHDLEALF